MPKRALTPWEEAELLAVGDEPAADPEVVGVVAVVAWAEELPEVEGAVVELDAAVKVTPTAAQRPWAAARAACRSEPLHELSMQEVVLATKAWLVHRQ